MMIHNAITIVIIVSHIQYSVRNISESIWMRCKMEEDKILVMLCWIEYSAFVTMVNGRIPFDLKLIIKIN